MIKMTLKGAGRRIAYATVQSELRQGIRSVNARIREERRTLGRDTKRLSWVDWLQQQASSGRSAALDALRVPRGRDQATTISAARPVATRAPDPQDQLTKQGTVIQKVGEHEIRDTGKGLNVAPDVGDDVWVELLKRAAERYEGGLTAYGADDFQLRLARVAGANHLAVSFVDPAIEKARAAAQAGAPTPLNKAALELRFLLTALVFIVLLGLTCFTSTRPGAIFSGRTNGRVRTIMHSLPKLLGSGLWSRSADSCFCCWMSLARIPK